jgi:hypothetical protein
MHEGKGRPIPCQYCGILFCTRFSLKRHIRSKHREEYDEEGEEEGEGMAQEERGGGRSADELLYRVEVKMQEEDSTDMA